MTEPFWWERGTSDVKDMILWFLRKRICGEATFTEWGFAPAEAGLRIRSKNAKEQVRHNY